MTIKPIIIASLETALNHYINLDDNVNSFLAPLDNKVIAITITPFNETIYLCPNSHSIQCLDAYPHTADTHLTGSLFALGLMGLSANPMNSLFSGQVIIEGDTQIGQQFQTLFKKLDINLEAKLARYTGHTIANGLGQLVKTGKEWGKESLETLRLNTSEFIQEESRDVPASAEAEEFYNSVDELRLDFDRLQSRVERLESYIVKE